jgi:hypothetical protein
MRKVAYILGSWSLAMLGVRGVPGSDGPSPAGQAEASAQELFRQKVEPLLRVKCLGCHGDGEELDGDLDLRSRGAMLRGGKSGPALVPGRALASLIYQAVRRTDERVMPPKERPRLEPDEIAALKSWIEAGAPWASETGNTGNP